MHHLCSALHWQYFIQMMFQFNFQFKDERCFLCIHDAHDYNVKNCILLLNDYHSLSRKICNERKMYIMKDQQQDLSVWDADYKSSASYACQKS